MLPDLTISRAEVERSLHEYHRRQTMARMGIMRDVKKVAMYECIGFKQRRSDGSTDDKQLDRVEGTIRLDCAEVRERGLAAVLEAYDQSAVDYAGELKKHFFERMNEILSDAGQTWDAGGRPFTPELLLEFFEKIEIDFDSDGSPNLPTLIVPPDLGRTITKWNISDDQQRRFEQIIEQQRLVWRDRESDRRLVD